jgi:hypothetical protein
VLAPRLAAFPLPVEILNAVAGGGGLALRVPDVLDTVAADEIGSSVHGHAASEPDEHEEQIKCQPRAHVLVQLSG